ncbi:hypothetical protein [Streptomyces sp. 8N706]|uniref:hypothetical protein n=1 Tax=Streptomyces sp. 8N706 TaxID=3457416 RepID=UPI003FD58B05
MDAFAVGSEGGWASDGGAVGPVEGAADSAGGAVDGAAAGPADGPSPAASGDPADGSPCWSAG